MGDQRDYPIHIITPRGQALFILQSPTASPFSDQTFPRVASSASERSILVLHRPPQRCDTEIEPRRSLRSLREIAGLYAPAFRFPYSYFEFPPQGFTART